MRTAGVRRWVRALCFGSDDVGRVVIGRKMYMEHREGVTATAERSEEDGIGRDGPDFFTPISCDRSVFSGAKRTTDGLRSELNPHR